MTAKTQTGVHSRWAQRSQRNSSEAAACRAMASVQLSAQLLLWCTLFGYDRSVQCVWQATLLLLLPMAAVVAAWRFGASGLASRAGPYLALALLPCLALDACALLWAMSGLIGQVMPQYPGWTGVAVPAAACVLTALCARPRGVRRGAMTLRGLLLLLFVCGTFFLRASSRTDRLWPLWGRGIGSTLHTALLGAGCVWNACLLFILPHEAERKPKAWLWAVVPWALSCLWALWLGLLRPWGFGDALPVAQKLTGLARNASSVAVYELGGLMWMLLLPLSLTGCLSTCETLALRAFPKCPRLVPLLALPLPAMVALLWLPDNLYAFLETALPWRTAACLLCGAALWLCARREKRV